MERLALSVLRLLVLSEAEVRSARVVEVWEDGKTKDKRKGRRQEGKKERLALSEVEVWEELAKYK